MKKKEQLFVIKELLKDMKYISYITFLSVFTFIGEIEEQEITPIEISYEKISEDINSYAKGRTSILTKSYNEQIDIMMKLDDGTFPNCSLEYKVSIYKLAKKYNVPYEVMMTIGEQESGGNWNNTGVISVTDDYGDFQINKRNLNYLNEKLGFSKNDILFDRNKNAEAATYLVSEIINLNSVDDATEVFGHYNGWKNWKDIESSVQYVEGCENILSNYYPDYKKTESVQLCKN